MILLLHARDMLVVILQSHDATNKPGEYFRAYVYNVSDLLTSKASLDRC